jgi:hypothetical protein
MTYQPSSVAAAVQTLLHPAQTASDVLDACYLDHVKQIRADFLNKLRVDAETFRSNISQQIKDLINIVELRDNLLEQLSDVTQKKSELEQALSTGEIPEQIMPLVCSFEKSLQVKFINAILQSITSIEDDYTTQNAEADNSISTLLLSVTTQITQSSYINSSDSDELSQLISQSTISSLDKALEKITSIVIPLDSIKSDYLASISDLAQQTNDTTPIVRQNILDQANNVLKSSLVGEMISALMEVLIQTADSNFDQNDSNQRYQIYNPILISRLANLSKQFSINEWSSAMQELSEDPLLTQQLSVIDDALWYSFKDALNFCAEDNKEKINSLFSRIPISEERCTNYLNNTAFNEVENRVSEICKIFPSDLKVKLNPNFVKVLLQASQDEFEKYLPKLVELSSLIQNDLTDENIDSSLSSLELLSGIEGLLASATSEDRIQSVRFARQVKQIIPSVELILAQHDLQIDQSALIVYVFGFLHPNQHPNGINLTNLSKNLPGLTKKIIKPALESLKQVGFLVKNNSTDQFQLSLDHPQIDIHTQIIKYLDPQNELQLPAQEASSDQIEQVLSIQEELQTFFDERKDMFRILILQSVLTNTASIERKYPLLAKTIKFASLELMGETKEEQRQFSSQIFAKYKTISAAQLLSIDGSKYQNACNNLLGKYYKSLPPKVDRLLELIEKGDNPEDFDIEYQQLKLIKSYIHNFDQIVKESSDRYALILEYNKQFKFIERANNELILVGVTKPYDLL